MALRKIALEGETCLSKVCRPVTDFNSRLHTLLDDLADTLADSGGVGLAAPQVGVLRRVCVVLDEEDQLIELVNPEIIYTEGEQTGLEGCLSHTFSSPVKDIGLILRTNIIKPHKIFQTVLPCRNLRHRIQYSIRLRTHYHSLYFPILQIDFKFTGFRNIHSD